MNGKKKTELTVDNIKSMCYETAKYKHENAKLKKRIIELEGKEKELDRLRLKMDELLLKYSEESCKKGCNKYGLQI